MGEMMLKEYFKTKKRMCSECGVYCKNCPLSFTDNKKKMSCHKFELYYTDEAIVAVKKWGEEHKGESNEQLNS